jgi:lactate dehydrogenase-like 2-hydroxyacid dehydrogenase
LEYGKYRLKGNPSPTMSYRFLSVNPSLHDYLGRNPGKLAEADIEVVEFPVTTMEQWPEARQRAANSFDAFGTWGNAPIDQAFFENASRLEHIAIYGIGCDDIDVPAATRHGVILTFSPAQATVDSVAEFAWCQILSMAREVEQTVASLRAGVYRRPLGRMVAGTTLGIVGLGRIGKSVARRAPAFEMRTLAFDEVHDTEFAKRYGVKYVELEDLLAQSDFVVLCLPGSPENEGIIGREQLARMKPTAHLINVARYHLVDNQALKEMLETGRLAGAALDFWGDWPEEDQSLFELDQVVGTTHLGNRTAESIYATSELVIQQVIDVSRGHRPANMLNPEVFGAPNLRMRHRLALHR